VAEEKRGMKSKAREERRGEQKEVPGTFSGLDSERIGALFLDFLVCICLEVVNVNKRSGD